MSLWKQAIVAIALCVVVGAMWVEVSPEAARAVGLGSGSTTQTVSGNQAGRGETGGFGGQRGETRVVTALVSEEEAGAHLAAIGTAEAARAVSLFSQTTGIVTAVEFDAGDRVAKGDILVRLDDAEQLLAVERARITVEQAAATTSRYDKLSHSQAISAVQVEEAHAALASARNELAAAELALERRVLRAPFDGVMGFSEVDVGDMVTSTTEVATIDDRRTLFVEFQVPERFAALIAPGQQITATTAAFPGEVFAGQVAATGTRIDPTSRSMKVRAALPNEDDRLRPGMAFSVPVDIDTPGKAAVPKVAVQWDRDGAYVWKVVDGKSRRTPVNIVARTAEAVLVEGDIAVEDLVVAEGLEGLREGSAVAEAGEAPATATNAAAAGSRG